MRTAVITAIYEAARRDSNAMFLSGDFGKDYLDMFAADIPAQCINMGMAEQNMVGVAAGLALSGMKVFCYSIIPFATLRCLEQIKLDVAHHNLDVTIVGVGAGVVYGTCGPTHYGIEELGAMRSLPNLKVVVPANPLEARLLTEEIVRVGGPAYIRLNKVKEPMPPEPYTVELGKGTRIYGVARYPYTIFATGAMVGVAVEAAKLLFTAGYPCEVINLHTIKPLDADLVRERAHEQIGIFTVEEHNVIGGLGSAVAEVIAESRPDRLTFKRFGFEDAWPEVIGTQGFLREHVGLSAERLAARIREML